MTLPFATLDVFTEQRFTGNPLAVVFDADALDDARMQIIAREFGHPETVFVLKPVAGGTVRVRIFTPSMELPFAGHPTVGTAIILALKGHGKAGNIVLEEQIGLVPCTVSFETTGRGYARFQLPELPRPTGAAAPAQAIAAALGLRVEDIGSQNLMPTCWSAGNAFTFVPVSGLDAVRRCRPNGTLWEEAFAATGGNRAYIFCPETVDSANTFHARMFAFRLGITEDPATGSAAAAFAELAARALSLSDGEHRLTIEQGYEMGRPSVMELLLTIQTGKLSSASVGGSAVVVTEGTIEVR
jgi:trans-2,3-dihydro-3-hydroxyanthranilate isomerase